MLIESKIDESLLKRVIQEKFGISVISMTFIPKWETARACIVGSSKHTNFFVKIYSDNSIPDSAFRFAHDLYAKAGVTNITHPVATSSGQMRIQLGDFHIAIFDLISGTTAEQHKLTKRQLERLGELLARIHQSKAVIGEYSVRERFEIPFRDRLVAIFNETSKTSGNAANYKAQLKFFLEPHRKEFMEELETLGELQRKVGRKNLEFVNCHGEPSPGNVMSSNSGGVYLLDWDDPIFAPKEKDLIFFKDNIGPVMKGYSQFSKDYNVDQEVMEFYGHLWNLGEIDDYGSKILFENHSDAQNQIWLGNLKGGWDFTF